MQVIPPMWFWKKEGDAGIGPTGCPEGYFRSADLCYQNCKDDYYFTAGSCYEKCKPRFNNHGASCYKNIVNWYFKQS